MTHQPKGIILASSSPYRKAQLEQLGLSFRCDSPEVDEDALKRLNLAPQNLAESLAIAKAQALVERYPDHLIIGGDQVCTFKGEILGKPLSHERALAQLLLLQGEEHQLITSVACLFQDQKFCFTVIAKMKMASFSAGQLDHYLKQDEPYQCCGSYRLEAQGISLFEKIQCEDHTSIIGLPLLGLSQILRSFKLIH